MKFHASRTLASLLLAVLAWLALAGATATKGTAIQQPDKLIILSTSDVKGEFKPCG